MQAVAILRDRPVQLEWMLADRQVQLALERSPADQLLLRAQPARARRPVATPQTDVTDIAIGSQDAAVTLEQLQVFRDIYYAADRPAPGKPNGRLGPDEYFLLGDNAAPFLRTAAGGRPAPSRAGACLGRVVRW